MKTYVRGDLDNTWTGKFTLYKPMTAALDGQNDAVRYVKSGSTYELRAVADGGHAANRSYQWYSVNSAGGETPVSGATSSTLKVPATAENNLLDFRCTVSDGIGSAVTGKIGVREIYTIRFQCGEEGKAIPDGEKKYGESYTIPRPASVREDCEFDQWQGSDGNVYSDGAMYSGNADLELTAMWKTTQKIKASINRKAVIYGKTVPVTIRNLNGRAVSLESSNPKILKVTDDNRIKVVGFGRANLTVTASGNESYKGSSYTIKLIEVKPPKMKGVTIKKTENGDYLLHWKDIRKKGVKNSGKLCYRVYSDNFTYKPLKENSFELPGRLKGKKAILWIEYKVGGHTVTSKEIKKKLP
ncbi:MAG: hypothetical protein IKQ97_10160 [Eubacterium sp.]|nr:hypothetical protein [Eubacterium sp.]